MCMNKTNMEDRNNYLKSKAGKRRFANPEVYQKTLEFQKYLQENGIAWHNPYSDECTDDFGCCEPLGDYSDRIPSHNTWLKRLFARLFDDIKHGDQEHQDWLEDKINTFLKDNLLEE